MEHVKDIIGNDAGKNERHALGIGAHDFWISKNVIRKYRINNISSSELVHHFSSSGKEFYASSKELSRRIFKHYSYNNYEDLDLYDRADIVFNLCDELPKSLHDKYDLVVDLSSNYVTNITKSYANTSKMVKINGFKLVITMLGDMTNRFDLNPSPNFLIDFHTNNGFVLEKVFMMNRRGKILPYKRYKVKMTFLTAMLPFHFFLSYLIKTFLREILFYRRLIRKSEYVDYETRHQPISSKLETDMAKKSTRPSIKQILIERLPQDIIERLKRFRNRLLSKREQIISRWLLPDWVVYILLRKISDENDIKWHVTGHYKNFYQK